MWIRCSSGKAMVWLYVKDRTKEKWECNCHWGLFLTYDKVQIITLWVYSHWGSTIWLVSFCLQKPNKETELVTVINNKLVVSCEVCFEILLQCVLRMIILEILWHSCGDRIVKFRYCCNVVDVLEWSFLRYYGTHVKIG